jgi:hypothetical protein
MRRSQCICSDALGSGQGGVAGGACAAAGASRGPLCTRSRVVREAGGTVRLLGIRNSTSSAANWDLDRIRVGNYVVRGVRGRELEPVCVTIYTPAHAWMDKQGWGRATDCSPERVYMFDSYFPQANLLWPPLQAVEQEDPVTYLFRKAPRVGSASLAAYMASPDEEGVQKLEVRQFGRTYFCDWCVVFDLRLDGICAPMSSHVFEL